MKFWKTRLFIFSRRLRGDRMDFYEANRKILSDEAIATMKNMHVLLVGAGGIGGYVASGIVRLGVGTLSIVDMDRYEPSNLNRQLFSSQGTLGHYKAEVVREACMKIHGETLIKAYLNTVESLEETLLHEEIDYVIDAVDSIKTRLFLEAFASKKTIPLLHGAIGGWYGQIGIVMPESHLLSRIYGTSETGLEKTFGSPTFTPGVVGSMMISEFVKHVIHDENALVNKLLFIDLLHHDYEIIYDKSK